MPRMPPSTRDGLVAAVLAEIVDESGCLVGAQNCFLGPHSYQEAHAVIAARLRTLGLCAGQHEDGVSDNIVVSTNPPREGLWLEVHQICGGPPRGHYWCWGKIQKSAALWRIK